MSREILLIWALTALCSASCLFFLTAPSPLCVSVFLPLSHPCLQSCPCLFFLFSFCSTNSQRKIKVTVCCQQDLLLWAFCSSEEYTHSWSGWYVAAPGVSPTTSQLSLSWQPVSQHLHNEQRINILLYPHCSLCDLRHCYCALFKGCCGYKMVFVRVFLWFSWLQDMNALQNIEFEPQGLGLGFLLLWQWNRLFRCFD